MFLCKMISLPIFTKTCFFASYNQQGVIEYINLYLRRILLVQEEFTFKGEKTPDSQGMSIAGEFMWA